MSFISPEFVIFFCTVVPLFFWLPHKYRWMMLVLVGYFFYGYNNWQFVPLIMFTTLVDYAAALGMERSEKDSTRRLWLLASVGTNLTTLFIFKYFNFFNQTAGALLGYQPFTINVVLPLGISFYTFQAMSYTIEVYRRTMKTERNLGMLSAFVVFFPPLVAGPIERARHMLPQFYEEKKFDIDRVVAGFQLMLWGFFKKVVIADRLAVYVNAVYNDVGSYHGMTLILATVFFAFQIYCDFSGYSDIAIGAAKVMGFDLIQNFRQPYFSQNIREFWSRWHMSLSNWFRDYLYIPLGGNRKGFARNLLNLFIVFLVSGLWHGANWTFVVWGALHGIAVVFIALTDHYEIFIFGKPTAKGEVRKPGNPALLVTRVLLTFTFVTFTWIFFRANNWNDAIYVVNNLFNFDWAADLTAPFAKGLLGAQAEFYLVFILIPLLMLVDTVLARVGMERALSKLPTVPRWAYYYGAAAAVVCSGLYGAGASSFIYFQF